jgi:hypothetical protein
VQAHDERAVSEHLRADGTRREAWALEKAYASLPRHNFSETVLQAGLPFLSVSALPPLTWSDLGTPQRLLTLIRALGLASPWIRGRRLGGLE